MRTKHGWPLPSSDHFMLTGRTMCIDTAECKGTDIPAVRA